MKKGLNRMAHNKLVSNIDAVLFIEILKDVDVDPHSPTRLTDLHELYLGLEEEGRRGAFNFVVQLVVCFALTVAIYINPAFPFFLALCICGVWGLMSLYYTFLTIYIYTYYERTRIDNPEMIWEIFEERHKKLLDRVHGDMI